MEQDAQHDRYALQYGPTLMALVGSLDLDVAPGELLNRLSPAADKPLQFAIEGHPDCRYVPYWQVGAENFTCFPTLR
jgi:hypothetical protein